VASEDAADTVTALLAPADRERVAPSRPRGTTTNWRRDEELGEDDDELDEDADEFVLG
jgi:hypothetical protein